MSTTRTTPGVLGARHQHRSELHRTERDGQLRPDRFPLDHPRRPVHPGGDVDGRDRRAGAVQARDRRRPVVLGHAPEPRPEDRVHGDVRAIELAPEAPLVEGPHTDAGHLSQTPRVRGRRLPERAGVLEEDDGRPNPPATQLPRGHQTVARRCSPSRRRRPPGDRTSRPRARGRLVPRRARPAPSAPRPRCLAPASRGRAIDASSGVRTGFIGPRSRTRRRSSSRG